jgi:hypothetical protein
MAKKPFKGGNLDDFMSAGEAEARYGPQRYAAVYEDLRSIEVQKDAQKRETEFNRRVYDAIKRQVLVDDAVLSLTGVALVGALTDLKSAGSFAVGAGLGAFYLFLSQRSADSFGASRIEDVKGGPPALVAPTLLVLIAAKSPLVNVLPTLAGFFTTERAAVVAQAFYPQDMGLLEDDEDLGWRPFWFLYDRERAERASAKPAVRGVSQTEVATKLAAPAAERKPFKGPSNVIRGEPVLSDAALAAIARRNELAARLGSADDD